MNRAFDEKQIPGLNWAILYSFKLIRHLTLKYSHVLPKKHKKPERKLMFYDCEQKCDELAVKNHITSVILRTFIFQFIKWKFQGQSLAGYCETKTQKCLDMKFFKNHLIFKHFDQATTEETKSPYELQCLQLKTVAFIAGKKNPAIQKNFIRFSIEIKL